MRGLSRTLGALFAASVLTAPAWAAVLEGEPTSDMAASFDGNATASGTWFSAFTEQLPSSYVSARQGQGFSVTTDVRPNAQASSVDFSGDFSVAGLVKLPEYSGTSTGAIFGVSGVLWNGGDGFALGQTSTGLRVEYAKKNASSNILTTSAALSGWTSLVVVFDRNPVGEDSTELTGQTKVTLYVNGTEAATATGTFGTTSTPNGKWLSLGNIYGGAGEISWAIHTGLIVDEVRGYSSVLSAEDVATLHSLWLPTTTSVSREVSGADGTWNTSTAWTPEGVPNASSKVTLTAADAATLTLDADASIYSLTVDGTGSLTFAGSNSLTVTEATTISADTNVSGITASLGAVTIGEGKTLTMDSSDTLASLTGTYSNTTPSQVIYNATAGSVTADATLRAAIRDFAGLVTIKGSGANGMELPYVNNVANALSSRIVFDGGTHTFKYGRQYAQSFATEGHGDDYPTIDVTNGTTLNFYLKDLSGWNGSVGTTPAVIRAREGSTLNLKNYAAGDSGFFRDRLILDKNATVTTESRFVLYGGAQSEENLAQIAMLDSAEAISATLGGQVKLTNVGYSGEPGTYGASISVGTNATLKATAAFAGTSAGSLTKEGAGVLELSSTASTVASPLTINGGKVVIKDGSSWGTGTITVASGAGLDVEVSEANPQSLDKVNGSGAVSVSGTGVVNMTYSTFSATSLTLSVAAESTLKIHVAYSEVQSDLTVANVTLAEGQNAIFVLPDGREVTGSGTSVSAMQYYTWTPSESDTNWDTLANWTLNGTAASALPGASDDVMISLTADTTVTLPETVAVKTVLISGGDLTLSGGTLTTNAVASSANETLTVASGAGLVLDGSSNTEDIPAQISSKVTVNSGASLTMKGYAKLSAENVFNGTLTVESGIASVNAASSSLAGTITIEAGATMKNLRGTDALNYGGTVTVNVKGTLDMGSTRWTMGTNNKINLYTGGVIAGAGEGSNGALDWYRAGALEVLANGDATTATISANLRTRDQGNPTFTVASGLTLNITGLINGGQKVTIASGEVKLSTANTYTGGTVINENGIVTIANANALSTEGTISGAGIINVPGVLPSLGSSRFADDWTGRVKISGSNKGEIFIGNYGPTVEFAGASGYLGSANGATYTQNIILTGNGWTSQNGNSEKIFIFQGTLSGDGLLKITSNPANGHFYKFEGDVSSFTGSVTVDSNHAIFFAKDAEDSITFTQNKGKIVINKPVTVGGTWTANNGIVVNTDAELTGATGTGGTLSGAVTTANNAAFKVVGGAITLPGTLGSVANGAATFGSEVSVDDGATLKLTSTTPHTFTGAISGTGTVELTPAVTLTAASSTINAKLTGTGALTIGDGTNASAVTLTNAKDFTGSVAIKNAATLVLNAADTDTKVLGDYSATKNNQMTLEPGSMLQLQGGRCFPYVTGTGTIEVTGDFYFGVSDNNGTLDASNIDIVVNAEKTLTFFDYKRTYQLAAKSLVVNGTLAKDGSGASGLSVKIATGKSLSGTGTINLPLTFESGATLDVTAGALTAGTVAFATSDATVTVTLPSTAAAGTEILKCKNPADVFGKLTATSMPDKLKFAVNADGTAVVLAKAGNYTVGDQTFETLQAALNSISDGTLKSGTIVIDASAPDEIELTQQILVNGAYVGLDLGGKTLKVVDANLARATAPEGVDSHQGAIWIYQGSLTIYNGTIESDGRVVTLGALNNSGAKVLNENTAVLTLPAAFDDKTIATLKSTGKDAVVVFEGASLTTSGNISTTAVNCCAICGNGSKYNTAHITIEGGQISSAEDIAIYNPQYGSLKITGGTITGKTAVYVKGGEITITGGLLSGTGAYAAYTSYGNGAYATGDALVVDNHSGYAPLKVAITGGQFTSTSAAPIASYSNVATDVLTGFVSGGKFSQAIAGSLCAKGSCCVKTSGDALYPWTIGELPAISGGEGGDVTINTPEAKDVIGEIIANASATDDAPTAVEVLPGTKSGVALLPEAVADSLAIFGSSVTSTTTTADGKLTITVSYDFGIDSMEQTDEGIVITAKVQKPDGTKASFANGVTVTLVDADHPNTAIATATPDTNGTATFNALAPAGLAGKKLKVKASK